MCWSRHYIIEAKSSPSIKKYVTHLLDNESQCKIIKTPTDHICGFVPSLVTNCVVFGLQDSVAA